MSGDEFEKVRTYGLLDALTGGEGRLVDPWDVGRGMSEMDFHQRWARIGWLSERAWLAKAAADSLRSKGGRPQLNIWRAFFCWSVLHDVVAPMFRGAEIPDRPSFRHGIVCDNGTAVKRAIEAEERGELGGGARPLFPKKKDLASSISRGRTKLGMDDRWRSSIAETMARELSQSASLLIANRRQ
ncbi:hypothetical protein GCM10011392_34890 [Wenxinia marina]|nr:hypothetical protein GCM10011392_34890 [Wenxinia marina]